MSENIFRRKFESKSDTELERIIEDKISYVENARVVAIEILKERNGTNEDLELVEREIKSAQEKDLESQKFSWGKVKKKEFLTNDPEAPEFHSKRVITIFSAMFSTIFGAVLLMHNFKEVGNNKVKNQILVFAILYTIASIVVVNALNIKANLAVILNIGGSLILTEFYWNRYLGKDIEYRKRSWVKPAIISIIITIPFVLAILYGE